MKYVKHYRQQTVKTDDPKEFDDLINEIFIRAAGSGKGSIVAKCTSPIIGS